MRKSLGNSPEEQRGPGGLHILQKENHNGAGAGCPHVAKDEPVGKNDLVEQRIWVELSKKTQEFMAFGRRGRELRSTLRILWGFSGGKLEGPKRN